MDSWALKLEPISCPETSVRNYHYSMRNSPEDCSAKSCYVAVKSPYRLIRILQGGGEHNFEAIILIYIAMISTNPTVELPM
jgi:hypothetical protein